MKDANYLLFDSMNTSKYWMLFAYEFWEWGVRINEGLLYAKSKKPHTIGEELALPLHERHYALKNWSEYN